MTGMPRLHFLLMLILLFFCRCIPFRYRSSDGRSDEVSDKVVEVLMIDTPSGPGLLFPKV